MLPRQSRTALLAGLALLIFVTTVPAVPPPLELNGRRFVNSSGKPVTLRGCNLGNWLLLEPWMLNIQREFRDQQDILDTLRSRFGAERTAELLAIYRENWIGPRDIQIVRDFGFNLLRVPFHYSVLETDGPPYALRPDAFRWLDRAIELAEQADLYVILDMHGLPGGQSVDMTTGERGQNRLWRDETCQERTERLWRAIAQRYRNQPTVIAYDLANEPWGDYHTNNDAELVRLMDRLYHAVRAADPDKLILAAGSLNGIGFYGRPTEHDWRHVGYTEHFYPGMFGFGGPTLEWHAHFIGFHLAARQAAVERLDVPYLVGEFNVVFDTCAQPALMRRYYDLYASRGWMATMWSLRVMSREGPHDNNWYLETNAEPYRLPELRTARDTEIAAAFAHLGSMPRAVDEELRSALTAPKATPLPMLTFSAPAGGHAGAPPGLQLSRIGNDADGRFDLLAEGATRFAGTGADIWGERDTFAFWHAPADATVDYPAVLLRFDAPHQFAKAGVMLRADASPGSAHVLVHAHPDGRLIAAWRKDANGPTHQECLAVLGFPMTVALRRSPSGLAAAYQSPDGAWREFNLPEIPALSAGGLIGIAISSHYPGVPADCWVATPSAVPLLSGRFSSGGNLLAAPSFAAPDENTDHDIAAPWKTWGSGWSAANDALAFTPGAMSSAVDAGIYQDRTGLTPGQRVRFAIRVEPTSAREQYEPLFVELRIESAWHGRRLHVASCTWNCAQLAAQAANTLQLDGTLPGDNARVLIRFTATGGDQSAGRVRLGPASLGVLP
ncbi:MAG: cellulase family glycosylhydrolase [Phycisphaerales bacterium]|nr:cellulase family glycosylhydrolase [Phycisphaerales bacterium]